MSTFYLQTAQRIRDLLAANGGLLDSSVCSFVNRYLPGFSPTDIRAVCERMRNAGEISGYGHRPGRNRRLSIAGVGVAMPAGTRPGFKTAADNTILYCALHPDHEGRETIAKFGQSGNPDDRRYALFPHSKRLLQKDEMFLLPHANAVQVEQVVRLMFSAVTVGGEARQIREYVRAPTFLRGATRNIGRNARDLTFALIQRSIEMAAAEMDELEPIDRHNPARRIKMADRLVAVIARDADVKVVHLDNGMRSFAR